MIEIISDNIVSPLGFSTEQNYTAAKAGVSALKPCGDYFAAYIDYKMLNEAFADNLNLSPDTFSKVEKAAMLSVKLAVDKCGVDFSSPRTALYLSTTKGNVEYMDNGDYQNSDLPLWRTAKKMLDCFGGKDNYVVVSNACISGLSAIISAARALESHRIDCAVVSGVDMLSRFIVQGFSSLKALSSSHCRPFDIERNGLNLGEAAATVVMRRASEGSRFTKFVTGSVHNDAYHISSPSKTAEGSFLALSDVVKSVAPDSLAFINAHGTSTLYNDEMEAVAVNRAGLNAVPVNSLKAVFGHTLGAAGIVESIVSMCALNDNTVLKTLNFSQHGVSKKINIVAGVNQTSSKPYFVKLISGFGGCNAAALFKKGE